MSTMEVAQSLKTAHLELVYERALRQAERIYEEERVRALRVQLLLLEDENEELQEHAMKQEDQQVFLEETNEELLDSVAAAETELLQSQMDLKARERDLDHLKAEVKALNAASADATKLLSEKLSLSRELNALKPELEHLKSQSSTQQKLLSEKLALQRELASVQVELETERRAVQRIKEKQTVQNDAESQAELNELTKELARARREAQKMQREAAAEIDDLKNELAQAKRGAERSNEETSAEVSEMKKELAKAKREAQKLDRENRRRVAEWEEEKESLEIKLDSFRNKLKATKDELQEAQEEIEKMQAAKMAQSAELTKARINGNAVPNPRKRNVARFDPDMTIGTPGHGGAAAKKQRFSVNPGDKSTFSMTPFLNRTLSILPETPAESEEQDSNNNKDMSPDRDEDAAQKLTTRKVEAPKQKPAKPPAARKPTQKKDKQVQPLKESTNSKANAAAKKPSLEKLVEQDSDMDSDQENNETTKQTSEDSRDSNVSNSEQQPKKTKALKRANIFDEEDTAPPAPKVRTIGNSTVGALALGRISLKAKPNSKGKVLAEFSPLKKDRRAMV
ncbi:hypothetical protein PV10_02789 [Exophiala mesophila]|uniref:Uncharacterized protein n=1 Tax=Exophiala mesophila TaxID=212818 RepID=A0A0D1ZKG6_EXOME|nr:uncharacterized protein PV10_02789 [Exophiala mesophila]KIV95097.1 hypothetical protein PV10_02789 [Exophiala mesophila]